MNSLNGGPRLLIPRKDFDKFIRLVSSSNIEVGGVLIGRIEENLYICDRIVVGENILNSPIEFRLSDEFLANIILSLRDNEDIIGIIHSHPAPPVPSLIDRKYMRLWPIIWVIIDSNTLKYKGWFGDLEVDIDFY